MVHHAHFVINGPDLAICPGHRFVAPHLRREVLDRSIHQGPDTREGPNRRNTSMYNVTGIEVAGHVHRVGNSLAIVIPAKDARRAHLKEGDPVHAVLRVDVPPPFGLLKGKVKTDFNRRKEGLWRDRI